MNLHRSTVNQAAIYAALALVAGCSGAPGSQAGPPVAAQPLAAPHHFSISPAAKRNSLLYVTDEGNYHVYVYDYPSGTPVGTLDSAYGSPTGLCVDKKGDIFVTEYNGQEILEYEHGGSEPVQALYDNGQPIGCSVDPTTGNLAVANDMANGGGYGNIVIYKNATGTGQVLTDYPTLGFAYWCAYDNKGNLFISGETESFGFTFLELPAGGGSGSFESISLPDGAGTPPGQVGFDGKYVTLGSASSANGLIFQFTISGSSATLMNTTMLNGYTRMPAYFIVGAKDKKGKQGKAVVATSGGDLGFFKYPAGGSYTFQTTQNWPWSSAVSKGK
jgi:hypothetical protein